MRDRGDMLGEWQRTVVAGDELLDLLLLGLGLSVNHCGGLVLGEVLMWWGWRVLDAV